MNAGELIEALGDQVTWELLSTGVKWHVWASHSSSKVHSFKFEAADESLDRAVERVINRIAISGPKWIRDQARSIPCDISRR